MKYYRVVIHSPTHIKLIEIFEKMKKCKQASLELLKEVGAEAAFQSNFSKAGGIYCFMFDNGAPDGWKKVNQGWFPKRSLKSNADILDRIDKLPTVSVVEWAEIFGTKVVNQPGCFKSEGAYFASGIGITGDDFKEISLSEWAAFEQARSSSFTTA